MTDLTIGIVGGGQLARMMNEAATPLGIKVALLAEAPGVSAAQVVPDAVVGDYTDEATLLDFARGVDALTFDHEHVPAALLRACSDAGIAARPGPDALRYAQDKAAMRARLSDMGVPCPAWRVARWSNCASRPNACARRPCSAAAGRPPSCSGNSPSFSSCRRRRHPTTCARSGRRWHEQGLAFGAPVSPARRRAVRLKSPAGP